MNFFWLLIYLCGLELGSECSSEIIGSGSLLGLGVTSALGFEIGSLDFFAVTFSFSVVTTLEATGGVVVVSYIFFTGEDFPLSIILFCLLMSFFAFLRYLRWALRVLPDLNFFWWMPLDLKAIDWLVLVVERLTFVDSTIFAFAILFK